MATKKHMTRFIIIGLLVYDWMWYPKKVGNVVSKLMEVWKTRAEVNRDRQMERSRWINTKREFLQGDSFSPVWFCLTKVHEAIHALG